MAIKFFEQRPYENVMAADAGEIRLGIHSTEPPLFLHDLLSTVTAFVSHQSTYHSVFPVIDLRGDVDDVIYCVFPSRSVTIDFANISRRITVLCSQNQSLLNVTEIRNI
jgi:hypothetical protein